MFKARISAQEVLASLLACCLLLLSGSVIYAFYPQVAAAQVPATNAPTAAVRALAQSNNVFQEDILTPTNLATNGYYGDITALSSDGNTAIVGGTGTIINNNTYSGSAFIFSRSNAATGTWAQQTMLTIDQNTPFICGGVAMSGDGKTALASFGPTNSGGSTVYVFTLNNGTWTQSHLPYTGANNDYYIGVALNYAGNLAFVSSPTREEIDVFSLQNGTWSLLQKLNPQDSDNFASKLASSKDGNTFVVSAAYSNTISAYVYQYSSGSNWSLQQKLSVTPTSGFGYKGTDVSISSDGNTFVMGDPYDGAANVYARSGTTWALQQTLTDPDTTHATSDEYGYSVGLSGDSSTLIVGANSGNNQNGIAYLYKHNGSQWTSFQSLTASNATPNDDYSCSVDLSNDGTIILAGACNANDSKGTAYVYTDKILSGFRVATPVTATVGNAISATVTAVDQYGQPFQTYTGTVHLASSDAAATLPADYAFTASDNGTHTFSVTFATTGTQSLTASDAAQNLTGSSQVVVQAVGTTSYIYNLPFLGNNAQGGFTSYLAFQNNTANTANISLQFFDNNGTALTSNSAANTCPTLAAHAECLPNNPFSTSNYGSGVIVSDQPLNVIVAEGTPYGGSAYAVSAGSSNALVAPLVLRNAYGDFSTRLSIFNGDSQPATVNVSFYDQNGNLQSGANQTVNVQPRTTQILDQSLDSSNLPANFNGWAKISVAGGAQGQLVAQVLEQSPSRKFVAIANAQTTPQTTLYAPAIFKGAFGFNTGASIVNPNATATQITVTYYDDNGQAYAAQPFMLPANSVVGIYQSGTGNGLPANGLPANFSGSAIVTADGSGVMMVVNESGGVSANGTSLSGTYTAAANGSSNIGLPVMASGGYGYTTGATILNTTGQSVSGSIQYYNVDGTPQGAAHSFTIAAHASQLAYQGAANLLPQGFYGTAVVTENGNNNSLMVTTNAESGLFYTYNEPNS